MRTTIKKLNKRSLAEATDISYGRLRKFSSGEILDLKEDEILKIHEYLLQLAKTFSI